MTSTNALPDFEQAQDGAAEPLPFDYLRVSVTDRCQLNCAYCRPPEDAPPAPRDLLSLPRLVECCAAICAVAPIHKIRLSGGEPLLRADLPELVAALAALPTHPEITLTTNGVLLADRAVALAAAGLSRLNVSLDTGDAACYTRLTNRDAFAEVLRGLDAVREAGFRGTKINAVLRSGLEADEVGQLLTVAADHEAMLRLIEMMPLGLDPKYYAQTYLPATEALQRLNAASGTPVVPMARPASATGHLRYLAASPDGRQVTVEMISPMSRPFCADCRRIRLSCDGQLIPCLLSPVRVPLLDHDAGLPEPQALKALLLQSSILKRRACDLTTDSMWAIGG